MTKIVVVLSGCLLAVGMTGAVWAGQAENSCVQGELKALGYYTGEITGKIDPATKAAGDAYVAYMTAANPGWQQALLSPNEAAMWCKQLVADDPKKMSSFLEAAQGSAGLVLVRGLSVEGPTLAAQPYEAVFDFYSLGDVNIKAACFAWNAKDDVCAPLPEGMKKGPIRISLTTGRKGDYILVGYVKYDSNGKKFVSPETSFRISVE